MLAAVWQGNEETVDMSTEKLGVGGDALWWRCSSNTLETVFILYNGMDILYTVEQERGV